MKEQWGLRGIGPEFLEDKERSRRSKGGEDMGGRRLFYGRDWLVGARDDRILRSISPNVLLFLGHLGASSTVYLSTIVYACVLQRKQLERQTILRWISILP